MTSYGPPGPPPGPPPPPGSYGPPPSSGAAGRFDPKTVNPLDWGVLAAGLLSLIFSFFSYYSYSADRDKVAHALNVPRQSIDAICANSGQIPAADRADANAFCNGVDTSAWHGFFGWFGVVLALLAAALLATALFVPQVRLPVPTRLVALGGFALAVISTLIALFVVPDYARGGTSGGGVSYDDVVDESHGFSYWVVLVLVVVGLVLCFLRFQQTGGQWPGRTAVVTGSADYGAVPGSQPGDPAGYQQPGYQQPGYQQPGYQPGYQQPGYPAGPPQPGYQPPPAPQPGHQPPPSPPAQPGYPPAAPPEPGYQPPPAPPQPGYPPPPPGYPPPPPQPPAQ